IASAAIAFGLFAASVMVPQEFAWFSLLVEAHASGTTMCGTYYHRRPCIVQPPVRYVTTCCQVRRAAPLVASRPHLQPMCCIAPRHIGGVPQLNTRQVYSASSYSKKTITMRWWNASRLRFAQAGAATAANPIAGVAPVYPPTNAGLGAAIAAPAGVLPAQ